jgi:glycosyltransferase involved in cell wall biosynthesis
MTGGGAERQLVYLSGELVRRGWDVHVALLKEGPNFEGLVATGSTIHKIPSWGNHDIVILLRLMKLIRNIRPHLVQTWLTQMDVFGGIASRLTNTPFILSERSCENKYPPNFKNNLRIFVGRYAAAIVCNSPGGKEYWRIRLGNAASTYVVQNILPLRDIEETVSSDCDLSIPSKSKVLLFTGRFSPEKNIDTIIRAFKIVVTEQDAVLLLCGEGETKTRIEKIIREENMADRIYLPGYVKNIWGLMKRADLFISVSAFEGLPNAVLEAIACDCPLILSNIPSHRDFLNDEKAVFVDQGRVSDIASAISGCFEDLERARQRAQKAKADISSFSGASVAEQYQKIYSQILSDNT